MAQSQGLRPQMERLFSLCLYLAEDVVKISTVPGAPRNNMVSRRNYLLCHFSIGTIYRLGSFYATKYF